MFSFFRKNQKGIIIVIAVVIIITFSFFGMYDKLSGGQENKKDIEITKDLYQNKVMLSEINGISFFLANESRFSKNSLFDDLLKIGVGEEVFKIYFQELVSIFSKKIDTIKSYQPYVHNRAKELSSENVWKMFAPDILVNLKKIKKIEKFDLEAFLFFSNLYLAEKKFPSENLQRVIVYQANSYKIPLDRKLYSSDFKVFGFSSVFEWFSDEFINAMSQVVLNISKIAEKKGYKIEALDLEIAKQDFFDRRYFKNRSFVKVLKQVLLCKKYLEKIEDNVFVDTLSHDEIASVQQLVNLEKYSLPKKFLLKDFQDLLKFKIYLNATTDSKALEVSNNYLEIEKIEKENPFLVEKKFLLDIKKIDLSELFVFFSEKDLWNWQLEDKNFKTLKDKFFLTYSDNRDKRFDILESLDSKKREKLDNYSRKKMITNDFINKKLSSKESKKEEIFIALDFNKEVVKGIDTKKLFSKLENSSDWIFLESRDKSYYLIKVRKKEDKSILSFEKAIKKGVLDSFLENKLCKYSSMTKEEIESVKDKIGSLCFIDFLKEIDRNSTIDWKEGKGTYDQYVKNFLSFHMSNRKEKELEVETISMKNRDLQKNIKEENFFDKKVSSIFFEGNNPYFYKLVSIEKIKPSKKDMKNTKTLLDKEAKLFVVSKCIKDLKKLDLIKCDIK